MITCTRWSRNMRASRLSSAEEHGTGGGAAPAGPPLEGGQRKRGEHEKSPGHTTCKGRRHAGLAVGPWRGRSRQQGQRDVPGVLAEGRRRPANVREARDLEEALDR